MKLALISKSDEKKFDEWFHYHDGELLAMEPEDIAREAFIAGMREIQDELDRKAANEIELLDYIKELEREFAKLNKE